MALGTGYSDSDLVFATTIGTPLQPRNILKRHFRPLLLKVGLPQNVRLYDMRHTSASLLLAAGTNPKIVSEKLGHASVSLTLNVYSHTIPSMQNTASEDLERALAG